MLKQRSQVDRRQIGWMIGARALLPRQSLELLAKKERLELLDSLGLFLFHEELLEVAYGQLSARVYIEHLSRLLSLMCRLVLKELRLLWLLSML